MCNKPKCFGKYRTPQHDIESGCYTCVLDDECSIQNRLNRLAEKTDAARKDLEAREASHE